jgi:3-deoxy-manno-octulosonate cytidylyltransferase (CMP-KDO synthetase)
MAGQVDGITGNVVIVPARLGSTRLPSKPLADIAGVPLIVRVMQGLAGSPADRIIVATDSEEIASEVRGAGFEALLTGEAASGTERVFMAWNLLGCPGKRVINVQGDEPGVTPEWIYSVIATEPSPDLVVTLARRISEKEALSPSSVKIILDNRSEALYFSRHPVPYNGREFLQHVGIYCFSPDSLRSCMAAGSTRLSETEGLEQLAWMENGIRIRVVEGTYNGLGVDTPADLNRVRRIYDEG